MGRMARYSDDEKKKWVTLINKLDGNVYQGYLKLRAEGCTATYNTLRETYLKSGHIISKKVHAPKHKYSVMQKKEAVKLLEVNKYNYPVTLKQLNEIGVYTHKNSLRQWAQELAIEVCDNNRFKDVISKLSNRLAVRHTDIADKVYAAKDKILDRLIELIPTEKDMNKLSNAYKSLNDILDDKEEKSPLTFIQQYNSYYQDNGKQKNRDQGNIQDVTPERE